MLGTWFNPNIPGLVLFVLLLLLDGVFLARSTMWIMPGGRTESTTSLGVPTAVEVTSTTEADGLESTDVRVRWHWLAVTLLGFYLVSMAAGRLLSLAGSPLPEGRPRPVRSLLLVIGGTLLLALVAALATSKMVWGYFLSRPQMDARIVGARLVVSVTDVETQMLSDGSAVLVPATSGVSAAEQMANAREDHYYNLETRALLALADRGHNPASAPAMPPESLTGLYRMLESTGRLEAGDSGYTDAKLLSGFLVEAVGADARPLLFVGVRGGQVSNDHFPYYEFLFAEPDAAGVRPLLSFNRFYYDVAGMEGFEWPGFFSMYAAVGLFVAVPGAVVVMLVRQWRRRRAFRGRGFDVQPPAVPPASA